MRRPRQASILAVLLTINGAVLLLALGISAIAVNTYASTTFMQLMDRYQLATESVQGMLLSSIHHTMILAGLGALVVGALLSWWLTQRVVRPLRNMESQAHAIAAGRYEERVAQGGTREITRLGEALNAMAQNLSDTETLRRNLVTNLGHELRTPLANIGGYIEGMQDGVFPADEARLQLLQEEVARLSSLVDGISELTREDAAGRHGLQVEPVDVKDLVEGQVALFTPRFLARNLSLTTEWSVADDGKGGGGSRMFVATLDGSAMLTAVANLLENACRYCPAGGRVRIVGALTDGGRRVSLRFGNTLAEPLSERDQRFLFERFYRGDPSRTRGDSPGARSDSSRTRSDSSRTRSDSSYTRFAPSDGGIGIGLAIVKQVVVAHGGTVHLESGQDWIEFTVELPIG